MMQKFFSVFVSFFFAL